MGAWRRRVRVGRAVDEVSAAVSTVELDEEGIGRVRSQTLRSGNGVEASSCGRSRRQRERAYGETRSEEEDALRR